MAVDYALSRRDLPDKSDRTVCFVDVGQAGVQVFVMKIRKGAVEMVSHAHEEGVSEDARATGTRARSRGGHLFVTMMRARRGLAGVLLDVD